MEVRAGRTMNDPPDSLDEDPGGGSGPLVASYVEVGNSIRMECDQEVNRKRRRNKYLLDESPVNNASELIPSNSNNNKINPTPSITTESDRKSDSFRTQYISSDTYPYLVHVQRIQSAPGDGSTLHPVSFGNFLKKNNILNIVPGSVKRIGRNRCAVAFSTFYDANSFLCNNSLKTNKLSAKIPTFQIVRMGLIRGVPAEWSPEEVTENISLPTGCGKILKVRRINYKVTVDGTTTWKPSQSIIVTFDGQFLPRHVYMCYNSLPVELYIFPTIQCFKCCRYGHTKTICRSNPRCYKCGQDHIGESCTVEENNASCLMCGGSHYAINKVCPEFSRQKNIKTSMAQNNISYLEAIKIHPQVVKPYADILNNNTTVHNSSQQPTINKSNNTSYKKTVFLKPKPQPKLSRGYNIASHQALLNEYSVPTPANGCGLVNKDLESQDHEIIEIASLILSLLNKNRNTMKPSNVALLKNMLHCINNNNYGFPCNPMELQEHSA